MRNRTRTRISPRLEALDGRCVPALLGLGPAVAEVLDVVGVNPPNVTNPGGGLFPEPPVENDGLIGDISNGVADALPFTLFGEPAPNR